MNCRFSMVSSGNSLANIEFFNKIITVTVEIMKRLFQTVSTWNHTDSTVNFSPLLSSKWK